MRYYSSVFLYTAFYATLLCPERFQCHSFQPSPKALRESVSHRTTDPRANGQQTIAVRNSPSDNDSSELAESLSVHGLREGDATTTSNGKIANYLSAISPYNALKSIKEGCRQRITADPEFVSKSIFEVIIAASTQYLAEVSRRGQHRIVPEIDFVFAGILTAVFGKYYAMWKVARTQNEKGGDAPGAAASWRDRVPTNAFQPTLLDGHTPPTLSSRFLAFLLPMPQLFRAGVIASTIGYGFTSGMIRMRSILIPNHVAATQPVSVPLAAVYTGVFMAFVSNIRYQLLQGVVEPYLIDGAFLKIETLLLNKGEPLDEESGSIKYTRQLKKLAIVSVRWANGILGSWIAIGGMRACGLQKLKD